MTICTSRLASLPDPAHCVLRRWRQRERAALLPFVGELAKMLTDGKSRTARRWGRTVATSLFFTNARRLPLRHQYRGSESGSLPRLAFAGDDSGAEFSVLIGRRTTAKFCAQVPVVSEAYLYIVDLSSGQKREVESRPPRLGLPGRITRDGQVWLHFGRDGEFACLNYANLSRTINGRFQLRVLDIDELVDLARRPLPRLG